MTGVRYNMIFDWPMAEENEYSFPGEILIFHGLLSNAPENPTWAVSLHTLELYHTERQYKPNYAIQNFIQALCRRVQRPYHPNLTSKFSEVYDLYLSILRMVDKQIAKALGRDEALFEIRHFCPCCTYTVDGEPALRYKLLYSLDGGNSYKRFKEAGSASHQFNFNSSFIIDRKEVDKWKHVIKRTERKKSKKRPLQISGEFAQVMILFS
jgi:hypothetical protein